MSLSNHVLIGDVIAALVPEYPHLPDEIYLVQTALACWDVRLMKDGESLPMGEDWIEFDSAQLEDITA